MSPKCSRRSGDGSVRDQWISVGEISGRVNERQGEISEIRWRDVRDQ